jgi:hypothetical protein
VTVQPATEGTVQAVAGAVIVEGEGATSEPPLAGGVVDTTPKPEAPMIEKRYREQVGYGQDFRWVTGQLCRVHTPEGSFWVVRYAGLDQVDKYGGSVVLAPVVDMRNYREGDLICITGEVLKDRKAPAHLGGALYRVTGITMVTRGDAESK